MRNLELVHQPREGVPGWVARKINDLFGKEIREGKVLEIEKEMIGKLSEVNFNELPLVRLLEDNFQTKIEVKDTDIKVPDIDIKYWFYRRPGVEVDFKTVAGVYIGTLDFMRERPYIEENSTILPKIKGEGKIRYCGFVLPGCYCIAHGQC